MELQKKLRQDFEFYSRFTESISPFPKKEDNYLCEAWIQKLTGEQYNGIGNQYNRNIYLSNLVLCIQKGRLSEPFTEYPPDHGLQNASDVFGPCPKDIKDPVWLHAVVDNDTYCNVRAKDKRTYLATKAMPDGKGALGYIAVSLAEGEPQWIQRDGGFFENRDYENKVNPPKTDGEIADQEKEGNAAPEKSVMYCHHLLREIKAEISGTQSRKCENIERLIKLLEENLKESGLIDQYSHLPLEKRRKLLLMVLQEKIKKRILKLDKKKNEPPEPALDVVEVEEKIGDSADIKMPRYETGDAGKGVTKFGKSPSMKYLYAKLTDIYPEAIVSKFLYFLARDKERITKKLRDKHNKTVAQLKNKLKKDYYTQKKNCDDAELAVHEIKKILSMYREAAEDKEKEKKEIEEENLRRYKEHEENCFKLKKTLSELERKIAEEERRGQRLCENLENVQNQTRRYQKFNEQNLKTIEEQNSLLVDDIAKLTKAIEIHEQDSCAF